MPPISGIHVRRPFLPYQMPLGHAQSWEPPVPRNRRFLALDLAVLGAILWVSLNLGLDPVASVGIGVGLERGQLAAAVGAAVLDLANRIGSVVPREPECLHNAQGLTWVM